MLESISSASIRSGARLVEGVPQQHERHALALGNRKLGHGGQVLAAQGNVGVDQKAVGARHGAIPPSMRRTQGTIDP